MTSDVLRVVNEARSRSLGPLSPSFNIQNVLLEGLEKFLPEDAHLRVSGKLHVSLTRVYDGKNVIVSQFNSREDLLQVNISLIVVLYNHQNINTNCTYPTLSLCPALFLFIVFSKLFLVFIITICFVSLTIYCSEYMLCDPLSCEVEHIIGTLVVM